MDRLAELTAGVVSGDADRVAKVVLLLAGPSDSVDERALRSDLSRVYWLDSPLRQLFKAPAWGWADAPAGPALIASFSPQAVLENRAWLAK